MKRQRTDQQELRNKRRKLLLRRLQEQEWERQRHIWRVGRRLFSEDFKPEEEAEEQ